MLRGEKYFFIMNDEQNLYILDRKGQLYKQIDFGDQRVKRIIRNHPYLMV